QPNTLAVTLDGCVRVPQQAESVIPQGGANDFGTVPVVMISQDCDNWTAFPVRKYLGAGFRVSGPGGAVSSSERVGDEVARDHKQIGTEWFDQAKRPFDVRTADEGTEMYVAELSDAKAVKLFWKAAKGDADLLYSGVVRLHGSGRPGDSANSHSCEHPPEKSPACENHS